MRLGRPAFRHLALAIIEKLCCRSTPIRQDVWVLRGLSTGAQWRLAHRRRICLQFCNGLLDVTYCLWRVLRCGIGLVETSDQFMASRWPLSSRPKASEILTTESI